MRGLLALILCLFVTQAAQPTSALQTPQTDAKHPFRTDNANPNLPWYRLKAGEFPPKGYEHRVGGELVETDVIHRAGVFRRDGDRELVNFTLPPYGAVFFHNTEADLRDVPLGTHLQFWLYQDAKGVVSQAVRIQDKDTQSNSHMPATEQQRKQHFAFLKERGLPAWIDRVEGDRITVTLFSGDPDSLKALFKAENIDPARWAREHHRVALGVANEHLRSYWPNVTNRGAMVMELQTVPTDTYGCSGVRLVLQPELMLEGFRKGRIVRLFAPGWPIEAMPFGEGLFAGGHDEEPADSKEFQPADFPYRTDFGNENLPWFQLQPGKVPPDHSEHRVGGELVKIDSKSRTGQFRTDRMGEVVNFTMPPLASVRYLNTESSLEDLPLGMRCLFFLYQDDKGAFTQAALIEDEFSYLASNTVTYRVEATHLETGRIDIVRHAAPVQTDYVLEPRVPLDFGKIELEVDDKTRVWKGDKQIKLTDIAVGDELLVNLTPRTPTSRGRCTDIWVGAETHRLATEQQRKKHTTLGR
ncbi:MAG: hypothetical protein JWN14_2864 [Chthonomonadales bacterium]|nr:hypothetical protein [Chthonomonadales bacterium]